MGKKILILVDSLKIGGGSDKFAAILGSELYNKGYDVFFLTLSDENPKYQFNGDYYTLNEKDIYGNNIKRFFKFLKYSFRVKKLCEELEIDIIISAGDPANFHAILSRWLFGNKVRIIITQHMTPEIFLDSKIRSLLIKFFFPHADKTVCVSKEIEKILNEKYDVQNTLTIYNMMDMEENIKKSNEKLPYNYAELMYKGNQNSFNFINIGRLDKQKGQWFLIRSFKKIVDRYKNVRLFILGEGDLRYKLKFLINELNLNENVFLLGEQKNIFPFLKNSHCFISSSLWEGLPLTLIEASSINLPIISTDCKTGPREILCPELDLNEEIDYPYLGEYAILSQPFPNELIFNNLNELPLNRSEETLVNSMIRIIEDKKLRKDYTNGQVITSNFDKEKILPQWSRLLKKISG